MASTSMTTDLPALLSSSKFAESAYAFVNEKRKHLQSGLDALQKPPQLKYLSDLAPVLNSYSGLGQIEFDGVICVRFYFFMLNC